MAKIVTVLEGIPNRRKERRKEGKTCGLTKCLLGGVSKHLQPTYISSIRQGSLLLYLQCSFPSLLFLCPLKQTLLIQLILQNILGRSKFPGHVWRGTQKWKIGFPSWWDGVNLNKWISTNLHTHPPKPPLESSKFSYQQLGNVYESDSLLQNYYISNYYLDKELSISLPEINVSVINCKSAALFSSKLCSKQICQCLSNSKEWQWSDDENAPDPFLPVIWEDLRWV